MAVAGIVVAAGGCSAGAARITARPPARLPAGAVADCLPAHCYAPRQFRVAYGIQPLLDRGIDGRGQTVVLLEFAPQPLLLAPPDITDVRQDLARFDRLFGLPAVRLQVVTRFAGSAAPWLADGEEAGDVEVVHEIAPDAAIRVVMVGASLGASSPGSLIGALDSALRLALSQGGVISLSASWGEHCFTPGEVGRLNAALRVARKRHVTVVGSSGDFGAVSKPCPGAGILTPVKEVGLPASDPLVLAAGGTSLAASHATGAYIGETAWNNPAQQPATHSQASGGGFSHLFSRPSYQDGVAGIGATRGVPDVAADADPGTGMALAASDGGGKYLVVPGGGTSAAAPFWAALIALADQYAGRHLGFVNPGLYRIGRSALYHKAFHDVTTGTNTVQFPPKTITGYRAAPGWDPVTGWGSPNAQVLVPLLARYLSP